MTNPYLAPTAVLNDNESDVENNSGGGKYIDLPNGVKGWSWGAFLLNWVWAIFNKNLLLGLLCFMPYIGFIGSFYLGFKGRELAWRNKRWESLEHFNRVQKKWSIWGLILVVGVFGIGILAAVVVPAYSDYSQRAHTSSK